MAALVLRALACLCLVWVGALGLWVAAQVALAVPWALAWQLVPVALLVQACRL